MRIINLDEPDFFFIQAHFSGSFKSIRELNLPINVGNEMRSLVHLREICDDYLSRYPTTLDEDVAMLKEGTVWDSLPASDIGLLCQKQMFLFLLILAYIILSSYIRKHPRVYEPPKCPNPSEGRESRPAPLQEVGGGWHTFLAARPEPSGERGVYTC